MCSSVQISIFDFQVNHDFKVLTVGLDSFFNGMQQSYDSNQSLQIVLSPSALQCIDEIAYEVNTTRTKGYHIFLHL